MRRSTWHGSTVQRCHVGRIRCSVVPNPEPAPEEGGFSGRTVVILLMVVSALSVVAAFAIIKPPPGFEPVSTDQRPFGPATEEDYINRPLITKGEAIENRRRLDEAANE